MDPLIADALLFYRAHMALQAQLYAHVASVHAAQSGAGPLVVNDCGCAYCDSLFRLSEAAFDHYALTG